MLTRKKPTGFTIVELIIVILVIAILALIVITTYNGVQQKARNAKTVSAAEAWIKTLRLFNAENGTWPTTSPSCLGENYPSGFDSSDSSTGQCEESSNYKVKSAFATEITPYVGSGPLPTPDLTAIGDSSDWRRGIWYSTSNSSYNFYVVILTGGCPRFGGATFDSTGAGLAGGTVCRYKIQPAS